MARFLFLPDKEFVWQQILFLFALIFCQKRFPYHEPVMSHIVITLNLRIARAKCGQFDYKIMLEPSNLVEFAKVGVVWSNV